jgi:hypothetical protein
MSHDRKKAIINDKFTEFIFIILIIPTLKENKAAAIVWTGAVMWRCGGL